MERPILFSAPMVRAILDGRKTMTRRVVKDQEIWGGWTAVKYFAEARGYNVFLEKERMYLKCPYGKAGDRLWVRETWNYLNAEKINGKYQVCYRATDENNVIGSAVGTLAKWRPSIFMPRWASRIALEIKNIRVERLHEITDNDSIKEGIERVGGGFSCSPWRNYRKGEAGEMSLHCSAPTRSFMTLWQSIYGPESWNANPLVWVVEFERI